MPEVMAEQPAEDVIVVRQSEVFVFHCTSIIGEPVFVAVALDMQGGCLSQYVPNCSETVREQQCVTGTGCCVSYAWGMGKYVCHEHPKIIQQVKEEFLRW